MRSACLINTSFTPELDFTLLILETEIIEVVSQATYALSLYDVFDRLYES